MRKQNKFILWPTYFDSTKTRQQGRRIPKSVAVPSPRLDELQKITQKQGFQAEIVVEAKHPGAPWQKTGLIVLTKNMPKTKALHRISKDLWNLRNSN